MMLINDAFEWSDCAINHLHLRNAREKQKPHNKENFSKCYNNITIQTSSTKEKRKKKDKNIKCSIRKSIMNHNKGTVVL